MLMAAQLFQPERKNPTVDPSLSFEAVAKADRALAGVLNRACANCHSNRTTWPWYSRVSPVSWIIVNDVQLGRENLNFSEWRLYGEDIWRYRLKEACEEVKIGLMPPGYYTVAHPEAKLSPADVSLLCASAIAPNTPIEEMTGVRRRTSRGEAE